MVVGRVLTATERYLENLRVKTDNDKKTYTIVVAGTGAVLLCAGAYFLFKRTKSDKQSKPGVLGLSAGTVGGGKSVKEAFKEFTNAYETDTGTGIREQVSFGGGNDKMGCVVSVDVTGCAQIFSHVMHIFVSVPNIVMMLVNAHKEINMIAES